MQEASLLRGEGGGRGGGDTPALWHFPAFWPLPAYDKCIADYMLHPMGSGVRFDEFRGVWQDMPGLAIARLRTDMP